jgi:putrescine transport system substrate-binding protein
MYCRAWWQIGKHERFLPGILAAAVVLLAACGADRGQQPATANADPANKVLHVYNWADYIGESTIQDFETRTGIKVTYDVYDSNDLLETKLLTGHAGYDVVGPSSVFLTRGISAGVFQKLDRSKLPNLANMDPEIMRGVAEHDPGNEYSIVYLWGTTGIGYNPAMVGEALGTRTISSWAAVFDPAQASRLAQCGIAVLDSAEVMTLAFIYLGIDLNSKRPEDIAAAEAMLLKVRPYIRYFHSSRYVEDLAAGEICVAIGWSGGVFQAGSRGARAARPTEILYSIPAEGAPVWFDTLAIPADAANPDAAHAFINYVMDPAVIAGVTNVVGQPSGNRAAFALVREDLRDNPAVYPGQDVMRRLRPYHSYSLEEMRALNRSWTRVRNGQ